MDISSRQLENCVILDVHEDNLSYPKTVLFKAHITRLMLDGHCNMVLNLSDVKMLDSFGIAAIVSILKLCKENHGNMTLYGLNDQIQKLMEMTHMDRVLEIWSSEAQAVTQMESLIKASQNRLQKTKTN